MAQKIEFKETEKYTAEVWKEIQFIKKSKGLTPESLLESARKKTSPLHEFFEWDDTKAAEKWRIQQSRFICNEITLIIEGESRPATESVIITFPSGEVRREYEFRPEILNNKKLRTQMIDRAFRELQYWAKRNKDFYELKPIFVAIEKEVTKWQKNKK